MPRFLGYLEDGQEEGRRRGHRAAFGCQEHGGNQEDCRAIWEWAGATEAQGRPCGYCLRYYAWAMRHFSVWLARSTSGVFLRRLVWCYAQLLCMGWALRQGIVCVLGTPRLLSCRSQPLNGFLQWYRLAADLHLGRRVCCALLSHWRPAPGGCWCASEATASCLVFWDLGLCLWWLRICVGYWRGVRWYM